jgi:hypothetical protein
MLVRRATDFCFNAEPVAHGGDFAEWNASLYHAERARIHPQKQDAFAVSCITPQVLLMRWPGIIERIVNVFNRRTETQFVYGRPQALRRIDQ